MKVRTRGKSGLLLYAGPRTEKDFFALKLKDGKPVFQFDNGIGIAEVFHSKSINDGQWHKVLSSLINICLTRLVKWRVFVV